MVLMLTADHGSAVSGAHNAIVAARAGKDLVSSLTSGILTIGEHFGGALDGAAEQFSAAYGQGLTPTGFGKHVQAAQVDYGDRASRQITPKTRFARLF
jgi:ATP citrate (pro-S)-lyase